MTGCSGRRIRYCKKGDIVASSQKIRIPTAGKPVGRRTKRHRKRNIIIISLCVFILAMIGSTVYFVASMLKDYNHDSDFPKDDDDLGISSQVDTSTDIVNIALFGVDADHKISFSGHSDSVMVISVDKKHNKIKLVSFLRDSLVKVEGHQVMKLTEAYFEGGAELAVKTLNQNYGLDIRDYAVVNYEGMSEIIDAVGGIEIEITEGERKNANTSITEMAKLRKSKPTYIAKAGKQQLNGLQAVAYARIRKVNNPNGSWGDFGRTDRQRLVMEKLFEKALKMGVTDYPRFIKALLPHMKTSLDIGQVARLVTIFQRDVAFEQTRIPDLDYIINVDYRVDGKSTVYYNLEFASDILRAFIYDDIHPNDYLETHPAIKTEWL